MRVVINGLAALKPKTGVGHHTAELAAHLAAEFPADAFDLYPGERVGRLITRLVHRPGRPATPGSAGPHSRLSALNSQLKELAKRLSGLHFAAYARAGRFDLYHDPNFVPYRSGLPTVVTVHDLSVARYPGWHPADRVRFHDRHFGPGLARAAHVIVVSEAVRREVVTAFGLPPGRVTAVPNGVGPAFRQRPPLVVEQARRRLGLPPRFLLVVGTVEPRKNVGTVLRAFADLPPAVRSRCPLVLAGPWGWKSGPDREYFEAVAGPRGARHLGYVPAADLPLVYAAATALVYPSHYEGFGLPPLEMLATGGAVLASTAAAVREVVGRCGWFVDPADQAGWRNALRRAATDPDFVAQLRTGGPARAAKFPWTRAAAETYAVYRRVLGAAAGGPASRAAA